jgi:hypothetical protein
LSDHRDPAAAALQFRHPYLCTEMAQHGLSMIAGRVRLDHRGLTRCRQSRQQDRRFHLRGGHRQGVLDRHQDLGPDHRHRQASALAPLEPDAHLTQRNRDPRHRTSPQGSVAGENGGDPLPGRSTHQQTDTGPGVPAIDDHLRLGQSADPTAVHPPDAVAVPRDFGPESTHGIGSGDHVLAFQQALDRGLSDGHPAENQGSMRDRLVAGHFPGAGQRFRAAGD